MMIIPIAEMIGFEINFDKEIIIADLKNFRNK